MFDKIGTSQWYWMLSLAIARKKNKDVVAEKTPQRKMDHILLCSLCRTENTFVF